MKYERRFPEALSMRLPRVRFTVRTMMVGTSVVGIALALALPAIRRAELTRRRADYLRLYHHHIDGVNDSLRAMLDGSLALQNEIAVKELPPGAQTEETVRLGLRIRRFADMKAYHEGLVQKYRAAAERPWLPVEPDPPMPK